jgi:single-strand DNA-binding protein
MASINKVILIGNLGRDPETRYTADNNTAICHIVIATSRRYKDSQGELQEETEWHRVVFFGRQAEVAQMYLRKGNPVYIEGRLRTRRYTDKEGIERYQTEIICETLQLLGSRSQNGGVQGAPQGGDGFESPRRAPRQQYQQQPYQQRPQAAAEIGDDMPRQQPRPQQQSYQQQPQQAPAAGGVTDEDIPF